MGPRYCLDCREDGSTHGVLLCPLHLATPRMLTLLSALLLTGDDRSAVDLCRLEAAAILRVTQGAS
jgi:hypothetical protein